MPRERGVMLDVVDYASTSGKDDVPPQLGVDLMDFGKLALVTIEGQDYFVCSEGVRWKAQDDAAAYFRTLPQRQVDLADFVRTFGSRLETNFYMLHRKLA